MLASYIVRRRVLSCNTYGDYCDLEEEEEREHGRWRREAGEAREGGRSEVERVVYCSVLYSTVLFFTVLCCTVLYCTTVTILCQY